MVFPCGPLPGWGAGRLRWLVAFQRRGALAGRVAVPAEGSPAVRMVALRGWARGRCRRAGVHRRFASIAIGAVPVHSGSQGRRLASHRQFGACPAGTAPGCSQRRTWHFQRGRIVRPPEYVGSRGSHNAGVPLRQGALPRISGSAAVSALRGGQHDWLARGASAARRRAASPAPGRTTEVAVVSSDHAGRRRAWFWQDDRVGSGGSCQSPGAARR
jgi:hypothetical protein